jgi:hypothetical protein
VTPALEAPAERGDGEEALTAYQRGNRDALLSFAKAMGVLTEPWEAEVARTARAMENPVNSVQANAAARLNRHASMRLVAMREAAYLARRMAEALPDDPMTYCAPCQEEG